MFGRLSIEIGFLFIIPNGLAENGFVARRSSMAGMTLRNLKKSNYSNVGLFAIRPIVKRNVICNKCENNCVVNSKLQFVGNICTRRFVKFRHEIIIHWWWDDFCKLRNLSYISVVVLICIDLT